MSCDNIPYYLKPYFWLLIFSIILFLVLIVIVESTSFTTNSTTSVGIWLLFLFIILFLIMSYVWYYYDKVKICPIYIQTPAIQQIVEPVLIHKEPCSLVNVYESEEVITYIEDDYLPLSALNPYY